jgi:nitroreductase
MAASLALLAASDAAISGRPAALVPDVLKDLEAGKTAVDKGNAEEAIKSLQAATDKAVAHPAAGLLNRAMAAARGAEEALYRQAWPVVVAELTEIDDRLAELSKSVAPPSTTTETTKPAAEAAPGGQAAPSTGEAGQGAAPPATPAPEAGAQTPPAATPAAGGEAAPARGQTERTKSAPPARAPRASQPQQQAPPAQPPAGS